MWYTEINSSGGIVRACFTENPNHPVTQNTETENWLLPDEIPEYDSNTQYIVRVEPVPEGASSIVYQIFDIIVTDEEKAQIIREQRNEKLRQSDWAVLQDSPLSDNKMQEWIGYRQLLRDITVQESFPSSVVWPSPPQ